MELKDQVPPGGLGSEKKRNNRVECVWTTQVDALKVRTGPGGVGALTKKMEENEIK